MPKHTAGPWTVRTRREHGSYCYEGGGAHATIASPSTGVFVAEAKCGPKMAEANAARIVACVNACEGMDDPGVGRRRTTMSTTAVIAFWAIYIGAPLVALAFTGGTR